LNVYYEFGNYLLSIGVKFSDVELPKGFLFIFILFLISVIFPNTQNFMKGVCSKELSQQESGKIHLRWKSSMFWLIFIILILIVSIYKMSKISEFLYFQF